MKYALPVVAVAAFVFFLSQDCQARRWETSFLAGYTVGGHFDEDETDTSLNVRESPSFACAVNTDYEPGTELELYYSRQATELKADDGTFSSNSLFDLDIHYLQIGGTVILTQVKDIFGKTLFEPNGFCDPYIVGTLGAAHLRPRDSSYDPVTRLSASLGFGTRLHATKHLGLRLEARGFATFIGGGSAVFSNSEGLSIYVDSDAFTQVVVNAGVFFDF